MNKKGILLLITILIPLLTGCWSRVEVNDIAIVTATAIDQVEADKIRLTIQIAIPMLLAPAGGGGGGAGNGEVTLLLSEEGETVMDAFRAIQEKLSRRIFFAHSRILIIGEKAARSGVSTILDFFLRYRGARLSSYIVFTKGEAVNVLKEKPALERLSSEVIREEENQGVGLRVNINHFMEMLLTDGAAPVAAQVEIKSNEVKKKKDSKSEELLSQGGVRASIVGSAVFKEDKLVGWMGRRETRGVLWLRNELETGVITVNIPKEKRGGKVSAQMLHSTTKIKPILDGEKMKFEVDVRMDSNIYENASKLDVSDPKVIELVEELMEKEIKARIQLALNQAQKQMKSDIFGFGKAVHQTYPKEWNRKYKERWDEEFPLLEVRIKPQVKVVRIGLTTKSLAWKEKGFKR